MTHNKLFIVAFFNDRKTHSIQQQDDGNCGRASFTITDESAKKIVYKIRRPELCVCAWNCEDVEFPILDIKGKVVV